MSVFEWVMLATAVGFFAWALWYLCARSDGGRRVADGSVSKGPTLAPPEPPCPLRRYRLTFAGFTEEVKAPSKEAAIYMVGKGLPIDISAIAKPEPVAGIPETARSLLEDRATITIYDRFGSVAADLKTQPDGPEGAVFIKSALGLTISEALINLESGTIVSESQSGPAIHSGEPSTTTFPVYTREVDDLNPVSEKLVARDGPWPLESQQMTGPLIDGEQWLGEVVCNSHGDPYSARVAIEIPGDPTSYTQTEGRSFSTDAAAIAWVEGYLEALASEYVENMVGMIAAMRAAGVDVHQARRVVRGHPLPITVVRDPRPKM